jgi:DNA-binding ferritin-like protein (Dps family)
MAAEYDSTEFVDTDFQTQKSPFAASAPDPLRAPTRDEVDRKVVEAQQKLAELKRAQDSLERERASLEELRRRQSEFQTGRQEMIHNLTRGLGLLEEAEFNQRHEAEQMLKTIADFRDALIKIEAVRDETWTKENFSTELTRALTAIENARMEWNTARLKLPALSPEALKKTEAESAPPQSAASPLTSLSFGELCKIGLAMTWPLVLVALGALGVFIAILVRH